MMRSFRYFLVVSYLFAGLAVHAQDSDTEDPYSDYSYLWEDDKAKKKEAKRKAKEEKKRLKELEKSGGSVSIPMDSSSQPETMTVADTSKIQDPIQPADSIRVPQDTIQDIRDSVQTELDEPFQEVEPPVEEIEEPEEIKEKKERSEIRPSNDFRSGMASGSSGGSFTGGFTFTVIDDQYYAGLVLNPEFKIGKVGVGLNIPILYGLDDQSIRTEIFKDGVGVARLFTYVRYGVQKTDPVYVKVGQLDNTMIGFGSLINNYTNTTSFEKRKLGLHYDLNFRGLVGLEGLYSDFNPESLNLFAIRPYVRPLAWTPIPIINSLEIGATIIQDKDQTRNELSDSTYSTYAYTRQGTGAFGIDMGMTLLSIPFIQIDWFAGYSKLNTSAALQDSLENQYALTNEPSVLENGFESGSGVSVGFNFRFHFIADILSTDVRIERLSYQEHYLPQFFDATYELNKDAKLLALGGAGKMSGIYGSLTGHILKKVQLGGSLMLPDDISAASPATVRVNADLERLADKFSFHGSYIKGNLLDLQDAFVFDENSLAKMRFIYHMNKFLAVGMDYFWAFTPTADGGYRATKYVSPYFGVSIAF